MACALKAELKCKDGKVVKFTVETEKNLNSVMEAVKRINADISEVLTELVDEEKARAQDEDEDAGDEVDEDEDEDDEDASSETTAVKLKTEPPAKRLKSVSTS